MSLNNNIIKTGLLALATMLSIAHTRIALADELDYSDVFGLSTGIGYTETDHNTGGLVYINFFLFVFNFSAEYKDYSDYTITNGYSGVGLGKYLQLQYGNGNEGDVYRARSEFNIYKNLSIMVAYERYRDNHALDNYSYGLGLTFE